MTPQVHDKLKSTTARYETLLGLVGEAAVQADPPTYRKHTIEMAELEPLVEGYRRHTQLSTELAEAREMAASGDAEMKALADDEIARLEPQIEAIEEELKVLLVPKDPNDNRNVVLEIRAGTGGDEAGLFAAELFRMYSRYSERRGLEGRRDEPQRHRRGRRQGSDRHDRRQARVPAAEARERRASGAARARDGSERPHPHVHGDRRRAARSRGSGRPDRSERPARRHVLFERTRRPEREHHLLGRAHHPPADRRWWCRSRTRSRRSRTAQKP